MASRSAVTSSECDLERRQPVPEERSLSLLIGQRQGALVGGPGLFISTQSSQQLATCGVRELIVGEITAREDRIDERKASRWAIAHCHSGSAIEFYNG